MTEERKDEIGKLFLLSKETSISKIINNFNLANETKIV